MEKPCHYSGCPKTASYGFSGEEAVACAAHRATGMVNLDLHRHARPPPGATLMDHVPRGLDYRPSVTHDPDRIVHSDHPHCKAPGCTKAPSYGFPDIGGVMCASHRRPGMTFLKPAGSGGRGSLGERYHVPRGLDLGPHRTAGTGAGGTGGTGGSGGTHAAPQQAPAAAAPSLEPAVASPAAGATASPALEPGSPERAAAAEAKSPPPDLLKARAAIQRVKEKGEDPSLGLKYLSNILKHPEEAKFRTIRRANHRFYSEVWLNEGMRSLFLALGFREAMAPAAGAASPAAAGTTAAAAASPAAGAVVVLEPLHANTLPAVGAAVRDLAGKDGAAAVANAGLGATALAW